MRIISKATITAFCKKHDDAVEPLMHWYRIAKQARWSNLMDVRRDFRSADTVGNFTVFNIGGNKYRLIAIIRYRWQVIYIRHVLTHSLYDKETWKE